MASTNNLEHRSDGRRRGIVFWYYVFWISILILITTAVVLLVPLINNLSPFSQTGSQTSETPKPDSNTYTPSPDIAQFQPRQGCDPTFSGSDCHPRVEQRARPSMDTLDNNPATGIPSQNQEFSIDPPPKGQNLPPQNYPLLLDQIKFDFDKGTFERNGTRYRLGQARLKANYPTDFRKTLDSNPLQFMDSEKPLVEITSINPFDERVELKSNDDFFTVEASFDIRVMTLPSFFEIESQPEVEFLTNTPIIRFTLSSLNTEKLAVNAELRALYRRDIENRLYEFEETLRNYSPFITYVHQELARAYVKQGLQSITIPSL